MKNVPIQTSRGQFHYKEYGNKENPTIFMIHGWPETSYCWYHVAKLMETQFHIITPDLRGAGGSNRDLEKEKYTKDQLALDNISILDQLGVQEFYLVGHDWGGTVAQEMAFMIPERILKLSIINMIIINNAVGKNAAYKIHGKKLFYPFWYQFFQNLRGLPEQLIQGREDIWVKYFMRGMSNDIPEESIQEYVKSYQKEGSITTAANLYRTMSEDIKRWATYEGKKFQMPTLLIHGNLDPVIISAYYEGVNDCFENVTQKSIKAGHFVMDEQPAKVASALSNFFSED